MVPLPRIDLSTNAAGSIGSGVIKKENVDDDFSFEYQSDNYGELTYKEWGTPATAEDEQFYIAMRWPYNPLESRSALGFDGKASVNVKQQVLQDFLKMYKPFSLS